MSEASALAILRLNDLEKAENDKKMQKYLVMSKKSSTFAPAFAQWSIEKG